MSGATPAATEILSMQHITKIYANGFMANKDITFGVQKGEIHGLVGENGAGKSTLMKVLFGQEVPEEGKIFINGQEVQISNPLVALEYGIGMVHQHFMLVPSLTVAENMVLGAEPRKKRIFFDYKQAVRMTQEVAEKYNLPINPDKRVMDLSVGYKQRVEILKILLRGAKILLLDEPTAVLTPQETEELFVQLKNLKKQGFTIIFISHKLNEIKEICDRITVLRDGQVVGTARIEDVTERDISRMMVGRDVLMNIEKQKAQPGESVLSVRKLDFTNMYGKQVLKNVSFDLRRGEIIGIAGVEGNGQSELAAILTGLEHQQEGTVLLNGRNTANMSIRQMREEGASFISEDRMVYDLVREGTIEENLISDRYYKKEYCRGPLMDKAKMDREAEELIRGYLVACDGKDAYMRTLSGGNMQKVITARECSSHPKILIASQPTRGIDVGATEFIRKRLVELRDQGAAILLFSADLAEVMQVSDRILVFHGGQIVAHIPKVDEIDENLLGEYMLGIRKQSAEEIGGAVLESHN